MTTRVRRLRVFPLLALSFVAFSATLAFGKSKLLVTWKNPKYSDGVHFKKVLVIGMSADPARRSDFEDALAAALTQPDVKVEPGNSLLLRPNAAPLNLDYVKLQVRDHHIDAVIVSRLVSVADSVTVIPQGVDFPYAYYNDFYSYYSKVSYAVYSPAYLKQEKMVRIETNLYAMSGENTTLVWTGTSDTFKPKNAQKVIKDVVKLVSEQMTQAGVI